MKNRQELFFMAGFPRAGSTLLMNILGQNPLFAATPTSGLITSVTSVRDHWRKVDVYRANDENYIYPKIRTMLKGMMLGYYEKELKEGKIPIDKNRLWVSNIDLLDDIFGYKVKFIYPIRNIIDCVISMEMVKRKSILNNSGAAKNVINEFTTVGRAENLLDNEGILGVAILGLRELIYRGEHDRFIFVEYDSLLRDPETTMMLMYKEMGLPHYCHDFNDIKQLTVEYDTFHGFSPNSLHKIKEGKLMPPRERDLKILAPDYINKIENEKYKDIGQLINNIRRRII